MKKTYSYLLILATLGICMLPFLPAPVFGNDRWSAFLGRFHILLVHFPVVMVMALIWLELARWWQPSVRWTNLLRPVWMISLLSCFSTVIAGYLLYLTGEYQGDLVRQHLWGGVLLTGTLVVLYFLRKQLEVRPLFISSNKLMRIAYPSLLMISAGLVIYTSHLGGSLTHGPGFLTEHLPAWRKASPTAIEQKPPEMLLVFQDLILPALDARCLSCHNEHKTKGDLLMTSFAALSKGGKSGKPMLVEGQPEQSELYRRIILPTTDDEHMPPPEKPGLSEDEIALIRWWITEGASPDMLLGEGPPGTEGIALIQRYLPTLYEAQRLKVRQQEELAVLQKELSKLGGKLDLVIAPDVDAPGYFAVSQSIPPGNINDQTLSKLLPYASLLSKISLPGAEITDDGLYSLSKMNDLNQLYLPKTCIKGEGLAYLQALTNLKVLNLSYSFLKDEGALHLLKLPQLEKVYLFGTEVQANVLEALRKHMPKVKILEEEGPYF
ncbi:MAG: c-type cytochrome domain-containing protein [Saprospiraceae bacterium]